MRALAAQSRDIGSPLRWVSSVIVDVCGGPPGNGLTDVGRTEVSV
ncbi:hypothetical protein FM105_12240 [Brevibacterium yomogidense]|uniref:Uncharacterized protein n=1 Tax=Brevibacterium yomogidense TaxID=946573 RepID=A0A1X6XLT6_9MICO|nr:hypothetical protein FM105_12240 [Brevibacterium yomogidense]